MNALKGAIDLCLKIYEMHGTFTSNKELCERLVGQVRLIVTELKRLQDRGAVPVDLEQRLVVLIEDLRACVDVLQDFGRCSGFKRFVLGSKHANLFKTHDDHLGKSYAQLCLALLVDSALLVDRHDRPRVSERGLQTFEQAFQLDWQDYIQAYGVAVQNGELSAQLQAVGVSSRDLERHKYFSVLSRAADAPVISTIEEAQSCCWTMRVKELQMDKKEQSSREVRLGKPGSFGDVFSGWHCGTPVAVKKLRSPCSAEELASSNLDARASFAAFVTEVSFAFVLKHPNIVRTLGGIVDPQEEPPCWIVMERLQCSLADVPVLSDDQKLGIITDICSALVYLHSYKRDDSELTEALAHCDLKPDNIMYQDGVAKLIDFGIAKVSIRSTRGTTVKGTLNWMSPEQGLSEVKKTYTLCDMFSFGLIVKWLLVGVRDDVPFKDAQMDQILREHSRLYSSAGSAVHPFIQDLSLVPPVFRTLIQCCAATDPQKRWDAKEAMRKLRSIEATFRLTAADSVHQQSASHFPQVGYLRPSPAAQVGYHQPPPECIKFSESVAIEFPSSIATFSHKTPSAASIMRCFDCHSCNCCVSDYNPCTADLEPRGCRWFMEPFCAFFGLRIPLICVGRVLVLTIGKHDCGCLAVCCCPCFTSILLFAIVYFVLGLIMLPWSLCFCLAKFIRSCEKTCCGRPSTFFKFFYFPPLFLALSFHWMWKRLCCSRTCFGLCRGACGPDCQVKHSSAIGSLCIVCGEHHDEIEIDGDDYYIHNCQDGRRGSFTWNFDEGDPVCPC